MRTGLITIRTGMRKSLWWCLRDRGHSGGIPRAFLLVMLEQTEGDSWSEAAEITVDVSLNVAVCPARIEFFARTYPDHVGIFLEDTSIAQHLADGVSWKLSQNFLSGWKFSTGGGADQYGRIR